MAILTNSDRVVLQNAMLPETGGLSAFTRYFFDWEPLRYQFVFHHAPQPNITLLAGIGAGKTECAAMSEICDCMLSPYYYVLHTSISTYQAELAYEKILARIENNKRIERYIKTIERHPYPKIVFLNGSFVTYRTAGFQAQLLRGGEFDRIVMDEAGYEPYEMTFTTLRGRLRGIRPDGTPRGTRPGSANLGPRLDLITTPTDVEWLVRRWAKGIPDGEGADLSTYLSIRARTYDNTSLTKEQISNMIADYTEEMIRQEIEAELPNFGDHDFTRESIDACQDYSMNDEMQLAVYGDPDAGVSPKKGYACKEGRYGCTYWEVPSHPDHIYILAGDPGTDGPPRRNAGCVMVFDVTEKPFKMVYFDWVDGNGSYIPFIKSYKYAVDKYRPVYCGIDATGAQQALNELAFERYGIQTDPIMFGSNKYAMVNSLRFALSNHDLRFPFIRGLREQLRNYRSDDDRKIPQDIVATIMQITYLSRNIDAQKTAISESIPKVDTRVLRAVYAGGRRSRRR